VIYAILFDMDGVLTDSEPCILQASIMGLREYGINPEKKDFEPFIGAGEDRFIGGVAQKYGLKYDKIMKDRVYEIYLEIVDEYLGKFEYVPETLKDLKGMGYKVTLASSADMIKVNANLKAAGIDKGLFDVILSGEDVQRKKPFPDIYLKAAEQLNVKPEDCIVVEDAVNGVKAAVAAKMRCIGIMGSFSGIELIEAGAVIALEKLYKIKDVLRSLQ
ncbi:MAG TPA: HAD-IA family hydrolase, partial [Clostridia bacterium]|nr:HAD-IA family hydrolase [Clostridia bacterium]